MKHYNNKFNRKKKFTTIHTKIKKKVEDIKDRQRRYTDSWDNIRRQVYRRAGHRCEMCGKRGKLSAHHIVPLRVSKDNSLSNLVALCDSCHKKLEEVGFRILKEGGHRSDVRRVELRMIAEAKKERYKKGENNG